jgi:hypothetical protein
MWRELRWSDALRPLTSPAELARLLVGAGMLAHLPGADVSGLLDSAPLRGTLDQHVSFERITHNVKDGALTAARGRRDGLFDDT